MATYEVPTLDPNTKKLRSRFLPDEVVTHQELDSRLDQYTPGTGSGAGGGTAAGTTFTPTGTVQSTTVQAAIAEVSGDVTTTLALAQSASLAAAEAKAAVGPSNTGAPVYWWPTVGGVLGATRSRTGTYPPHPQTTQVYVFAEPNVRPSFDGNRVTGGGGMDVTRYPPDQWVGP